MGRWYFRVVEQPGGAWECRRGALVFDVHEQLDEAVDHVTDLAAENAPSRVFVHHLGGDVRDVAAFD